MELLYLRMLENKILDPQKLTILFTLYSKIKIHLNQYHYQPINGVPQGGINSPILFNFAMFYFLTDAAKRSNFKVQLAEFLPRPPRAMTPDTNFLWADDLATLFRVHSKRAKLWIQIYFTILIDEGEKWSLFINFAKSAIMEMYTCRTNYNFLSDEKTTWKKGKGCSISLNLYPNGKQKTVLIPIKIVCKYLGVKISRDLSRKLQIQALTAKSNYIINAFTSIHHASQDLKFCLNTWQLFI